MANIAASREIDTLVVVSSTSFWPTHERSKIEGIPTTPAEDNVKFSRLDYAYFLRGGLIDPLSKRYYTPVGIKVSGARERSNYTVG